MNSPQRKRSKKTEMGAGTEKGFTSKGQTVKYEKKEPLE